MEFMVEQQILALTNEKRRVQRLSFLPKDSYAELEVSAALRMAAVAIDLNSVANALTRSTAVFTIRLWRTTTHGIFTGLFLVCHGSS